MPREALSVSNNKSNRCKLHTHCTQFFFLVDSRMCVIFDFIIKYKCQVQITERSNRKQNQRAHLYSRVVLHCTYQKVR